MIKFFRNIRQQLLMENKTGKPAYRIGRYFKYAVGEIVLVVIGILIALQLNEWNDERKIRLEEQIVLAKLHEESETIVTYLQSLYDRSVELVGAIEKSAIALHERSLGTLSEEEFAFGVYGTAYFEAIAPPKNTFLELNNTGKIQIIRSETIRDHLSDYYSELEYINTQLIYFRNQFTKPVDAGGDDFIYTYNANNPAKIKPTVNFENLMNNKIFISKHAKGLRDQIVFNNTRLILLNKAKELCAILAKELKVNCNPASTSP